MEEVNTENPARNINDKMPLNNKVGQEQIHNLLFGQNLAWQEIIYDLINTSQLDPWDIDISSLAEKFLDKVKQLEEANFFVSSKVLLAASLLLRMKSEILLNHELPNLDAVLFGKKEEKKYTQEKIEFDEEIPGLIVKTPLPRFKKITLDELMKSLSHAINTENRRIKKIVLTKQQEYETAMFLPKQKINLKDKIQEVYEKLKGLFINREERLAFSDLAGKSNEERVSTFVPLLHLDNQHKVWLEQDTHFEEIWVLMKHIYEKKNAPMLEQMKKEVEEEMANLREEMSKESKKRVNKIETDFENPLGESIEESIEEDETE